MPKTAEHQQTAGGGFAILGVVPYFWGPYYQGILLFGTTLGVTYCRNPQEVAKSPKPPSLLRRSRPLTSRGLNPEP